VAHRGRQDADDRLALALASGKTIREAAADAGVSERTAHRRAADPAFRERVSGLRAGMVSAAAGKLADGMTQAATVLLGLMADPDPAIRFKAAAKVIELGVRVREAADLDAEVDRLREAVEAHLTRDGANT
jgi:hypothetical protein